MLVSLDEWHVKHKTIFFKDTKKKNFRHDKKLLPPLPLYYKLKIITLIEMIYM